MILTTTVTNKRDKRYEEENFSPQRRDDIEPGMFRIIGGTRIPIKPNQVSPNLIPGIFGMGVRLEAAGGIHQQDRMIHDKRIAFDRALWYSYQGAYVEKYTGTKKGPIYNDYTHEELHDGQLARALINPNKVKQDYDEKIISIGFEYGFKPGDIFEWKDTNTYWLVYLQELTEIAYFRANCRKCSYEISWIDEDGEQQNTMCAIRGPVETQINFIQKHTISVDEPNYSLNILMPKTKETLSYFKRYAKFYLQDIPEGDTNICWRVEAVDSISMPGILEINAEEYYANKDEDDIENGLVGALTVTQIEINEPQVEKVISGETFIRPKKEYEYTFTGNGLGQWEIVDGDKLPVKLEVINSRLVKLIWDSSYSGQFILKRGNLEKTIVVESLF